MDLIPRAEHEVGRMRLSMELAHLVRGGNSSASDTCYGLSPRFTRSLEVETFRVALLTHRGGELTSAPLFEATCILL